MTTTVNYDLIGDIHGHAEELKILLTRLDYAPNSNSIWEYKPNTPQANTRKAIFVGDLIDRGPGIREVLQIVKGMVDHQTALCIQGNHEYNAIGFWHQPAFRSNQSIKNINQHAATIKAFQNRQDEWLNQYVEWFKTLPIMLDLPGLRVVHAHWSPQIEEVTKAPLENPRQPVYLESDYRIKRDFYFFLANPTKKVIETTLKGQKIPLPEGFVYNDKDGNQRTKSRVKWWVDTREGKTYQDYLEEYTLKMLPELADIPIPEEHQQAGYDPKAKPIFFGHYWLKGAPHLQAPNVCCLDYSVAKGGELLAYRWSGEQELNPNNFVTHRGQVPYDINLPTAERVLMIHHQDKTIPLSAQTWQQFLEQDLIANNVQTRHGLQHLFDPNQNEITIDAVSYYDRLEKFLNHQ